jgi:DNA-binding transcriptional ArsR family regulator
MSSPTILWDSGTAYDLFISLEVLHHPRAFGLRGSWAAGVRQRVPADDREVLEQAGRPLGWMLHWVYTLPKPKDAASALRALEHIPAAERITAISCISHNHDDWMPLLNEISQRGRWDEKDLQTIRLRLDDAYRNEEKHVDDKVLTTILDWWSHPAEYGERYLNALRTYHEVFFAEEEQRIAPMLDDALARAQKLSQKLSAIDLMDELTQGLRLLDLIEKPELVLAPSYWTTPLASFDMIKDERILILFGARPNDVSLVPGDPVPEMMLRTLKALSDPTRLRILRYLIAEPMTPAQLSRRLRLRAPTVLHHLDALRLARLVHLTLTGDKEDRRYTARLEAVTVAFDSLKRFLEQSELADEEVDAADEG